MKLFSSEDKVEVLVYDELTAELAKKNWCQIFSSWFTKYHRF